MKKTYPDSEDLNKIEEAINKGKGEALFKADIDKKTGSIVLTSEQKERKFAEEILQNVIEEFRKELDKASFVYSEVLALEKAKTDKSKVFVFYVVENPNSLEKPVKPKRKLIIAVFAISSLFAGIFLAFLAEWLSKARNLEEVRKKIYT